MVEKEQCAEKKERNLETKCTTVDVEKCQQVEVWSCFFCLGLVQDAPL